MPDLDQSLDDRMQSERTQDPLAEMIMGEKDFPTEEYLNTLDWSGYDHKAQVVCVARKASNHEQFIP